MGGKKGAANLVHAQTAWVGAGSYDAINDAVAQLVAEQLQERRHERPSPAPYEPPVAEALNQVWGADIFEIKAWDMRFDVCDFIDIHNQEYLALDATLHAADSKFVTECFESACNVRNNTPPTVATKTDRGSVFQGLFPKALEGRTHHERIPPGCPWFNGESERGHRDLRNLLYADLSRRPKPKKGKESTAVREACVRVRHLMNEVISKPSLGNVTPKEIADGSQDEVRKANDLYVEEQREVRRHRKIEEPRPLLERLRGMLGLKVWPVNELLRFLRLRSRDYKFIEEG
jgi:transposase InsO family protein